MDINRRNFLKTASISGLAAGLTASEGLFKQVQAADQFTQSEGELSTILAAKPDETRACFKTR